jgi:hypothetical protein
MGDVLVFVHFTFFRLEWCLETVGVRGKVQRGISEMPSLQLKSCDVCLIASSTSTVRLTENDAAVYRMENILYYITK